MAYVIDFHILKKFIRDSKHHHVFYILLKDLIFKSFASPLLLLLRAKITFNQSYYKQKLLLK